jgi:hypothetical protein
MIAVSVSFLVENNAPCWRIQILRRDNQYGFSSRLSRYIRGLRDAMCAIREFDRLSHLPAAAGLLPAAAQKSVSNWLNPRLARSTCSVTTLSVAYERAFDFFLKDPIGNEPHAGSPPVFWSI